MEIFSYIIIGILAILLIISSVYLFAYYSHPEDRSPFNGILTKLIIFFSFFIAVSIILALTIDISNNRDNGLGIEMKYVWYVLYFTALVLIVLILPTTSSFVECEEELTFFQKLKSSICQLLVMLIVSISLLIAGFIFLNKADIPVTTRRCSIVDFQKSNETKINYSNCEINKASLKVDVSFPLFTIGCFSFFSWIIFIFLSSVGTVSIPLDYLYNFTTKPKKIKKEELENMRQLLILKTKKLKDLADNVKEMEESGVNQRNCK